MKRLRDIIMIYIPAGFLLLSLSWVLVYRWLPVMWTPLMLVRSIENRDVEGYENKQNWVFLENVDPVLIESILMAEDQRFFSHKGFDWIELAKMKGEYDTQGKPIRGCSTTPSTPFSLKSMSCLIISSSLSTSLRNQNGIGVNSRSGCIIFSIKLFINSITCFFQYSITFQLFQTIKNPCRFYRQG